MPLEEAMRTQRSIRRLKPDPVDETLLLHLLELAIKAPTGGNRQNAEFVVVRDLAVKRQLAQLNRVAWNTYGWVWKLFARNDEPTLRAMKAVDWEADHYEDIPVIVVACLRWSAYGPIVSGFRPPFPPFLAAIYYGSIFPAVQNLLLAARAAGLGASLTVMPLWNVTLARRALGLPIWVSPVAVIPMGWPRGRYGPTTRQPIGDLVHFDRYGNKLHAGRTAAAAAAAVQRDAAAPSLAARTATARGREDAPDLGA
jgi:nitroreductase